jgi:hypothetical protein
LPTQAEDVLAAPVPDKLIWLGELPALLIMLKLPVIVPAVVGAKVTMPVTL